MHVDKDNRGLMSITDITRDEALALKRAVKDLIPTLEHESDRGRFSQVTSMAYRGFVKKSDAVIDGLNTLIYAVSLFFPSGGKKAETIGELADG